MGRPLTGSIRVSPSGRFEASIPSAKGSTQRVVATFDTQAEAQTQGITRQWVFLVKSLNGLALRGPRIEGISVVLRCEMF